MCNQCYGPSRVLIGELEDIIDGSAPGPRFGRRMWPAAAPAVAANRRSAADIHWGCFDGTNVRASDGVLHVLKLPEGTTPTEEEWANAVAAYQKTNGLPATGILDAATWQKMLKELKPPKFKPLVIPVIVNGKKLGFIEKTMPYLTAPDPAANRGGALIELGFRITDPDAVKKAGFSSTDGRPPFRWLQTIELAPIWNAKTSAYIRPFSQVIDPTALLGAPLDKNPYYWDEEPPPPPTSKGTAQEIDKFINQPAANHLCYDLIFQDHPAAPYRFPSPGHRYYINVETALVGIKQGDPTRNTILDTVTWGYDLVPTKGTPEIRLNHLGPGVKGGSPTFRKILSKKISEFQHHCYAGAGYSKAVTCK